MEAFIGTLTSKDYILQFLNGLIEKDRVLDMKKVIINTPEPKGSFIKATIDKVDNSYYFNYEGESIDITNLQW